MADVTINKVTPSTWFYKNFTRSYAQPVYIRTENGKRVLAYPRKDSEKGHARLAPIA